MFSHRFGRWTELVPTENVFPQFLKFLSDMRTEERILPLADISFNFHPILGRQQSLSRREEFRFFHLDVLAVRRNELSCEPNH